MTGVGASSSSSEDDDDAIRRRFFFIDEDVCDGFLFEDAVGVFIGVENGDDENGDRERNEEDESGDELRLWLLLEEDESGVFNGDEIRLNCDDVFTGVELREDFTGDVSSSSSQDEDKAVVTFFRVGNSS